MNLHTLKEAKVSNVPIKHTIVEAWPMIREDFAAFTKDPTCWFVDQFEKADRERDWESVNKLVEIFKLVNASHEE